MSTVAARLARQRRYRERQKLGLGVAPLEVDLAAFAERLVAEGYLNPRRAEDLQAVAAAGSRWLADRLG